MPAATIQWNMRLYFYARCVECGKDWQVEAEEAPEGERVTPWRVGPLPRCLEHPEAHRRIYYEVTYPTAKARGHLAHAGRFAEPIASAYGRVTLLTRQAD